MKKYLNKLAITICFFVFILKTSAQTIVLEPGAILFTGTGGVITSDGSLTFNGGGNLENYGTIIVKGDFNYNLPVISPYFGTLRLNGTTLQTIGGTSTYNISNIDFNNPAGFQMNKSLQAFREVNFTAGIVNVPSVNNPLKFATTAYIGIAPTNAKHVNGYVHRDGTNSFIFPTGNGTVYKPVGLATTANSYGVLAKYNSGNGGAGSTSSELDSYNTSEYWDIFPYQFSPDFPPTLTGQVTIYWDNETSTIPLSERKVAHKSGSIMKNEGGTVSGTSTLANGSVTSGTVSTWSPFMLGFKGLGGPLPVELISFTGKNTDKGNDLTWKTSSEVNFSHFEIEKSPLAPGRGTFFTKIGEVKGSKREVYGFLDHQTSSPTGGGGGYYRLSLIDQDGTKKHSNIIYIENKSADINIANVFPNPVTNSLTISYNVIKNSNSDLTIFDFSGKLIYENKINGEIGSNSKEIDVKNWPAGSYLVKITDGKNQTVRKIIKQ